MERPTPAQPIKGPYHFNGSEVVEEGPYSLIATMNTDAHHEVVEATGRLLAGSWELLSVVEQWLTLEYHNHMDECQGETSTCLYCEADKLVDRIKGDQTT